MLTYESNDSEVLPVGFKCHHSGNHNHPAPFPKHATHEGEECLEKIITANPKVTTTQLQTGVGYMTQFPIKTFDSQIQTTYPIENCNRRR